MESSFDELWFKPEVEKWRSPRVKNLKGFESLELQNHCEHCPGMAKNEHGDPMTLTCFTKQVAEVKLQVRRECVEEELHT